MIRNSDSITMGDDFRNDIDGQYHWEKGLKDISSYKQGKNWGNITKCTTKFKKWVNYPEINTKLNQKILIFKYWLWKTCCNTTIFN